MANLMNTFLTQSAAIGVITLITIFPSPEKLREALKPEVVEVLTPLTAVPTEAVLVLPRNHDIGAVPISLPATGCLDADPLDSVKALNTCAKDLSTIVRASVQNDSTAGAVAYLDPEVEQARRALVEICRLRWVMQIETGDPDVAAACDPIP